MRGARAAIGLVVAAGLAALALSGGTGSDPRTPPALPGLPPVFFGTAVLGSGGPAAAVDSYGNVVDLRRPGPAGEPVIAVDPEAQRAGAVDADEALVARAPDGRPLWLADAVEQSYLPGTNVLRTVARFGDESVAVTRAVGRRAAYRDRRWLSASRPLGPAAPAWARRMQARSLLVLRALTDRSSGAVAAGARSSWAYVWPRDAAAVALALAAAGHRADARRVARFLLSLDLGAAARFDGRGRPVPGRAAQGDAAGWVAVAARAAGLRVPPRRARELAAFEWRGRADYQEKGPGDYLGNAIASAAATRAAAAARAATAAAPPPADGTIGPAFLDKSARRHREMALSRRLDDPGAGLDSAAAWAVRPFRVRGLYPRARRALLALAADAGPYGIAPSQDWPEEDPWTAPTAWSAWSLAALGERRAALRLLACLRRAATPLGLLPERVDARSGAPRSTTPLAWSHAFAILALRELWPSRDSLSSPR